MTLYDYDKFSLDFYRGTNFHFSFVMESVQQNRPSRLMSMKDEQMSLKSVPGNILVMVKDDPGCPRARNKII